MDAQLFWDERYGQADYAYGVEPNAFLKASMERFPKTGKVLCLGEGEGRNAVFLAKLGYEVCAIDISSAGKEKAEKLAAEAGVSIEYIVSDVNAFDFGQEKWDMIVSIFAHTDPDTRKQTYQKALTSLKENGLFILESYHPDQLKYGTGGPQDIQWLVALKDLFEYFPESQVIHRLEAERDVTEGAFHTGKAFVTQFIFKKTCV